MPRRKSESKTCRSNVSHAHRDLEQVREIRNELVRRGHNPLLFFLKCLEADDARLPDIIRDEIKARTFFVLCNTHASRRSKWVKQEIEPVNLVTKRPRETDLVMNLERDLLTELHRLDRLSKRATVFLPCARQDAETAVAHFAFTSSGSGMTSTFLASV